MQPADQLKLLPPARTLAMERDPGKQLFIDDYFIESMVGVRRVLNQPDKLTVDGPLDIPMDGPWEADAVSFADVTYDESRGAFRLYYRSWVSGRELLCALDSEDGIRWERPRLGLVEWDGSRDNNITNCPPGGLAILCDPHERDASFCWKRIDNKPTGMGPDGEPVWQAYHSADGYDWRQYPPGPHSAQPMLFNFGAPDSGYGGVVDPDAPYVYYTQRGSDRRTRVLGRRDSRDFLTWSGLRTVIDQDLDDETGTEFYAAGFDLANRTDGGLHLLMLQTFHTDLAEPYAIDAPGRYWGAESGSPALPARVDGFVDSQLAVSRDTISWKRFRQPFIPRGGPGAWDWGMLYAGQPIYHDNQLWLFYNGCNLTHNGRSARTGQPYADPKVDGKGLAMLRPDGFVGIEADSYAAGQLTTHRFRQESGGSLQVNVDAAAGELRYELLEDTGEPIPGYAVADCDPIREDTLERPLSWRGQPGWPTLDRKRQSRFPDLSSREFYIKLRFHLAPGTRLYSVTLDPPEVTVWAGMPGRVD